MSATSPRMSSLLRRLSLTNTQMWTTPVVGSPIAPAPPSSSATSSSTMFVQGEELGEHKSDLNMGVIGNCTYSALIDRVGSVVWMCLPRFDGDPVFCSLLRKNKDLGFFGIELDNLVRTEQHYVRNTAILRTLLFDAEGQCVEIIDFAPRFILHSRMFRPSVLIRIVRKKKGEAIQLSEDRVSVRTKGHPRVTFKIRPSFGYGWGSPEVTRGSNHIRYMLPTGTIRVTTNAPVQYVIDEVPFLLEKDVIFFLGPDESLTDSIDNVTDLFLKNTRNHWSDFVRNLSVPFEWQEDVIRAAITLKMCSFEETGAIVSAMTTSIPEGDSETQRKSVTDSRYCWLRDSYFVIKALNQLGSTSTMEEYLSYITNLIASCFKRDQSDKLLQPVYGLALEDKLHEKIVHRMSGYRGLSSVKVGTDYHKKEEHDTYGALILAATQLFFDKRLSIIGDTNLFSMLEPLGVAAYSVFEKEDEVVWTMNSGTKRVNTFSSVMCWAACDRLARIAGALNLDDRRKVWEEAANNIRTVILEKVYNTELGIFTSTFGSKEVDASLLLLPQLRFIDACDERYVRTVAEIEKRLLVNGWIMRTEAEKHETGRTAQVTCSFWYVDTLVSLGRKDEARQIFDNILKSKNHVGLLPVAVDIETGEGWGNYPTTNPLVGLISSAMKLSKLWSQEL